MSFVTLEDETGLIETTWFPDTYRACAVILESGGPVLFGGTVEVEYGVVTVVVRWAKAMRERNEG